MLHRDTLHYVVSTLYVTLQSKSLTFVLEVDIAFISSGTEGKGVMGETHSTGSDHIPKYAQYSKDADDYRKRLSLCHTKKTSDGMCGAVANIDLTTGKP